MDRPIPGLPRRRPNRSPGFIVATVLLLSASCGVRWARADEPLPAQLTAQFARHCAAVGDDGPQTPALQRARTWAQASTGDWTLACDIAGNRTIRPTNALRPSSDSFRQAIAPEHDKPALPDDIRAALVRETRRLASQLAGVSEGTGARVHVKREIFLVCRVGSDAIARYAGKFLVRLHKLPGDKYFQVVFSKSRQPIRIDTNLRDTTTGALADALADFDAESSIPPYQEDRRRLIVGTFFDPDEYRFELQAYSYEGEPFLDLTQTQRNSPFCRDHLDLAHPHLVDTQVYRRSKDYRHWCWRWWTRYGCVGAARGNWLPAQDNWEHQNVEIRHHKSLAAYALVGGEPLETREHEKSDGRAYTIPFAERARITEAFYDDLESCHVVQLATHGGAIDGRFRFRRNLDVWVEFHPYRKLGSGHLRHLFIEGCGSMTYVAEIDKRVSFRTWLNEGLADGIRTVCGSDGGHTGLDRSGWRFFGRYNKGDSISEAWLLRDMDENPENNPVTLAFGPTRAKALHTLLNGRFTRRPAKSTWAALSIWITP